MMVDQKKHIVSDSFLIKVILFPLIEPNLTSLTFYP